MNILITSAGRRGYLIKYFKEALNGAGKIYVGNSDRLSSAFYYADEHVVTPLIYEKNYIPFLLEYCIKNDISVILSLFDIDLLVLSKNKELFKQNGITVIVSDEEVIKKCNDKWNTYQFYIKNQISTPKTYLRPEDVLNAVKKEEIVYPLIIKPRWGMGSIAIEEADEEEELLFLFQRCVKKIESTYLKYESAFEGEYPVVIQEKICGQEYGMDIINDLDGHFCVNVIRRKCAMRAGETDCAIVERNSEVDRIAKNLSEKLHHIGNLDVDLFITNDEVYLLEMNARFGGGYPFSHLAGVNLPGAIIKWIRNEALGSELEIKRYGQIIQKDIGFVNLSQIGCEEKYE